MSSDFPPPPPPPKPPVPAAPPPPSPPPPPRATPGPASITTGPDPLDEVPPLTFSLTPFPPPPPPVAPPTLPPPTQSPAPALTVPSSQPRSSPTRRIAIAATIIVLHLIAGALVWSHFRNRVPEADLLSWLGTQTQDQVTFTDVTRTIVSQSDGSHIIKFDAHGTVPATLYTPENTADYLSGQLDLSPASPAAIRTAIETAADNDIRERAGVSDTPVNPLDAVVLRQTTPAGTAYPFSGVATARRTDGRWQFTLLQGTFTQKIPEGQPRATFGKKTYLAGSIEDDSSLRELVAQQNDYVARLEKAAAEIAEENKRDRESRIARFHDLLATGTLFTGHAALTAGGERESISLEITTARPGSRQISALLRNAGGWTDARPFIGTWKFDATTDVFSLNLMSRSGQAIPDAGPLLDVKDALSLALTLADDGQLTHTPDSDIAFDATRVDESDHIATKRKLTARFDAALGATGPDTLYHGTATAKTGGASEQVFLRFTKQSENGAALTASFESAEPGTSRKRSLRGAIVDNLHRAGDHPIHLQMSGSGRSRSARPGALFAYATDTAPNFKIDDTRLLGEDAAFTYEFTRITAAQAALLKKAAASSPAANAAAAVNYPRTSGVHVQLDGEWQPLPRNGGSTSQGLGGFAKGLFSKSKDTDKPASLVFKGNTPPPVVSGEDLVLTFKGKIPSRAKSVSDDYPLIEAARTAPQEDGTRAAPLERIASGFTGFGETRLPAKVTQPAADILMIAFSQTLEPGTYAILVGTDGYEFTVE
jgi:hypothetical protein